MSKEERSRNAQAPYVHVGDCRRLPSENTYGGKGDEEANEVAVATVTGVVERDVELPERLYGLRDRRRLLKQKTPRYGKRL